MRFILEGFAVSPLFALPVRCVLWFFSFYIKESKLRHTERIESEMAVDLDTLNPPVISASLHIQRTKKRRGKEGGGGGGGGLEQNRVWKFNVEIEFV